MINVSHFVVTDGRIDCLKRTLQSFHENCTYPFYEKFMVNDCMDQGLTAQTKQLADQYGYYLVQHENKKGFAGVYNTAWSLCSGDYVFNLEDDFTFNENVDIDSMIKIIEHNKHLVQIVLKRQPWNEQERKAGGIIEQWADLYTEKELDGVFWSEHNLFYSTNPSLTPKWVINKGWEICPGSEAVMSKKLLVEDFKSAYFGKKFDAPRVTHIGELRNGIGY